MDNDKPAAPNKKHIPKDWAVFYALIWIGKILDYHLSKIHKPAKKELTENNDIFS